MSQQFDAIHLGHGHIADDDIHQHGRIAKQAQRFLSVFRAMNRFRPHADQHLAEHVALERMVFDDQKPDISQ